MTPKALWLTGLSGSGKTSLAVSVCDKLRSLDFRAYVLDGDDLRTWLSNDLGFSDEDRLENIKRIARLANLFIDSGAIPIVSTISPMRHHREAARRIIGPENFIEVFVCCPIEICISRDPKGLYKKAMSNQIKEFTGISSPYEPPLSPDVVIRSDIDSFECAINNIVRFYLNNR